MFPAFLSPRPKSCSNIIGKHSNSKAIQHLSEEERYRTYTVKDMKMARTYLPKEVIRDFSSGFEASAKSSSTSKSRNFVRKLVATLEGKKEEGSGHCTADEEFVKRCFTRPPVRSALFSSETEEKIDFFDEKFAVNIKNLSQSTIVDDDEENKTLDNADDVVKNELKSDDFMKICLSRNSDSNSNYIFKEKVDHSRPTNLPFIREEKTEKDDFPKPDTGNDFSFLPVSSNTSPDEVYPEPKNKRGTFRRTGPLEEKRSFKNVLSSLMGFKNRKSILPKGKRNIFNTKESLGEEMRIFRRDMMPALLKAARPYNETEEKSSDETFSSIIAASRPKSQSSDRSASIHPFYQGKKNVPTFQQIREEENSQPQSGSSKAENDFKSQDEDKVVLRKKNAPYLYERPPAIIYDVPKSNKPLCPGLELKKNRDSFINYENLSIIAENNRNPNLVPSKNIVCGKNALYMKAQRLETQI